MSDDNNDHTNVVMSVVNDIDEIGGISDTVDFSLKNQYTMISIPLVETMHDNPNLLSQKETDIPFIYSGDLTGDVFANVIGKISQWLDLQSSNSKIRTQSEWLCKHQMEWAQHLGIRTVIFPKLKINDSNQGYFVN